MITGGRFRHPWLQRPDTRIVTAAGLMALGLCPLPSVVRMRADFGKK